MHKCKCRWLNLTERANPFGISRLAAFGFVSLVVIILTHQDFLLQGKNILRGETDGSSYPNGGLRATHRAGAYLTVDPTSPIFLRGDTIFIPACFVAFTGQALGNP